MQLLRVKKVGVCCGSWSLSGISCMVVGWGGKKAERRGQPKVCIIVAMRRSCSPHPNQRLMPASPFRPCTNTS